ncbi:hypothetical protein H4219_002390 [Mycoemilia scoparia]|uniref:Aldehyde dehydrogenase domain-containing protein n=1 Tax=Mycoemilia scoparia TaxID=417184 RepID=A0A9W8DU39_9FUNG|nr:hypothetical protein H4219_002390 [Mycoemilia scoparia]
MYAQIPATLKTLSLTGRSRCGALAAASLARSRCPKHFHTTSLVANAGSSQASVEDTLKQLGLESHNLGVYDGKWKGSGEVVESVSPATNETIATVQLGTPKDLNEILTDIEKSKRIWAKMPAPQRGEIVRQMRQTLADKIDPLGKLVSLEMGKILPEGIGEVQEYIDIADYAVGLSRMLNGKVIPSESK